MLPMALQEGSYSGTIPSQLQFTEVQYYIEAVDNAGNRCQSDVLKYTVGMPPWFYSMVALSLAIGVYVFLARKLFRRKAASTS